MENEKGDILYIGKAKNLAKRVVNYTSLNNLTRRLQRMVGLTKSKVVVTSSYIRIVVSWCIFNDGSILKKLSPIFSV